MFPPQHSITPAVAAATGCRGGADQTVLRLGPGQFFGDQATLRGQQGALMCHAVTRSILLAVDRTSLRDLLQSGID